MEKFKKLNRAEMKEVVGGVVHACFVTCVTDHGNETIIVPDCIGRGGSCPGEEYSSCVCR